MHFGPVGARRVAVVTALCALLVAPGCGGGVFEPEYEYEEELYLSLDGSATAYVHASVPALVALHGAALDPDPLARIDRDRVRAMFPGARVALSFSRRGGRRFVHARVQVDDVQRLSETGAFAWSEYRFDRDGEVFEFTQAVGSPAADVGPRGRHIPWAGEELVGFRLHLPSRVLFHNSPTGIERGNILVWRQPLAGRLRGEPVELRVQLEASSILFTTLVLFASTVAAVALTAAIAIWWIARRGRESDAPEA
jgi:hypothetical protein